MGSSRKDWDDEIDREDRRIDLIEAFRRREQFLKDVESTSFTEDIEWLWRNREKIIRNRRLIDIIG